MPTETPWHQKTPYAGVKNDPNEIVIQGERVTGGVNKTLTAEAIEQVRTGFRCLMCEEPQVNGAFPAKCGLCGFPMKEKQADMFKKLFKGEEWVGSTINWTDELDRLDDELERDNWQESPTSGIIIPRSVK
jgi:hypothetical protein